MKLEHLALLVTPICPLACAGLTMLVAPGSATWMGLPVFGWCMLLAFGVQLVMFAHSWQQQTEHFFDLTGSATYITVILTALLLTGAFDLRSLLISAVILIWALRLGNFLFNRVRTSGRDTRFTSILPSFSVLLMTWTLQGTWVSLTASCALAAIASSTTLPLDTWAAAGLALWAAGFMIEVVADRQKLAFRAELANRNRFITTGLWAWSRHPNYFGEIVLWIGIAVMAAPALNGGQLVTLMSPLFVVVLLTRISGVRMLELQAQKRWGGEPAYVAYRNTTSALIPLPPARAVAA